MLRRRTLLKQTIAGDLNTKLLLHLDNNVIDSSPYNVTTYQASGTSFTTGRFNQGFSGTPLTSELDPSPISTPDGYLSGLLNTDFTIDFWLYGPGIDSYNGSSVFALGMNVNTIDYPLFFSISPPAEGNNYLSIMGYHDPNYYEVLQTPVTSVVFSDWVHIAVTKNATTIKMYINGGLIAETSPTDLSAYFSTFSGTKSFIGISPTPIDEFRVSNIVRWTENFTPPTAPY